MKADERLVARKKLQELANFFLQKKAQEIPTKGWIRAFREALGMSTYQFAKRLSMSQSAALNIEKREAKKTISLFVLEKAARQLNCRLEYYIVPIEPIEETIKKRAKRLAIDRLKSVNDTMTLEDQSVTEKDMQLHLEKMIMEIINKNDPELWDPKND